MLTLIDLVAGRPWAIRADIANHILGILSHEGIAGLRILADLKSEVHAFDEDERARAARGGRRPRPASTVAVVPIIGTLTQREERVASASTRSTADIVAEVRQAAADPNVDATVLEVDSPGGEVFGLREAWDAIRDAGAIKPIVAAVNSQAASAAFHIASAAKEIWVTPSGMVGSVGTFALHVDKSKALEEKGEAWEFVVAEDSPHKVEGNPTGPLSEEARREMQNHVDRFMGMFVHDLARGRGVSVADVRKNFGQGRMVSPAQALKAGMIDKVGTFENALGRAGQLGRESRERDAPAPAVGADLTPAAQVPVADPLVGALDPVPAPVEAAEAEEIQHQREDYRRLWESA